jgi:hypothetical protein
MIRTLELYDNDGIDDDDPWSGILAAVMVAVRSTYSTTTQATPMQLVFGRDAIINTKKILPEFIKIISVRMRNGNHIRIMWTTK